MTKAPIRKKTARAGRRQAGRQLKPWVKWLLLSVLLILVLYVPVKKIFVRQIIDYGVTTQGMIAEEMTTSAAVIRQEKLVQSPGAGQFTAAVAEWEKVAAGQLLGTLAAADDAAAGSPLKIAVRASEPGLVSFHPDGWEGMLTVKILDQLDAEKRTSLLAMDTAAEPSAVTDGQPVAKIIDNLIKPSLYFRLPADFLKTLPQTGDYVSVEISGGELHQVKITALKKTEAELELVAEVINPCDQELQDRLVQVRIVPATYHGIILGKSALVNNNGKTGIMMLNGGMARWTEVELKGAVGDQVAVSGVDSGDLYIKNPAWVRDGQHIE